MRILRRHTFLLLAILFTGVVQGQDTLVYMTNEIKAVEIIEVNEELQLIGYVFSGDTLYISESSLFSYVLHSDVTKNTSSIEDDVTQKKSENFLISDDFVRRPAKFIHGKYSLGLNTLSLSTLTGVSRLSSISSNPVVQVYGEYMLNKHISAGLNLRFGLAVNSYELQDPNVGAYSNEVWGDQAETLIELGIQPTFYLNKAIESVNLYIRPAVYFGLNKGVSIHRYANYFSPSNSNYSTNYGYEPYIRQYYRIGGVVGFQINPWKSISLGVDVGMYTGNWFKIYYFEYANTIDSPSYELVYSHNYGRRSGVQGAINLIYRFGSKLRD